MFLTRAGLLAAAVFPFSAGAAGLFFNFNTEFSGGTAPNGPAPWINASFTQVSTGTVQLTISTAGLSGTEFISGFYFNLNPAAGYNPTQLSFAPAGSIGSFTAPTISKTEDGFMADGDGLYDVLFSFSTSGGSRFGVGDSITYNITETGQPNLSFTDFDFLSTPAGGHGPFYAAAHVQNTGSGGTGSGWVEPDPSLGGVILVPVPEPAPALILALSLGICGGARWWTRSRRPAKV